MADREAEILARLGRSVSDVVAAQWDALSRGDPFLSHAFLSSLEESSSVGAGTGWSPAPILVEGEGKLLAAAPAYLKSHSQGEYVFDHGWADAWERAGGQYYPKLQIAVPFTGDEPAAIGRKVTGHGLAWDAAHDPVGRGFPDDGVRGVPVPRGQE